MLSTCILYLLVSSLSPFSLSEVLKEIWGMKCTQKLQVY